MRRSSDVPARRDDQSGSLIIALAVVMVLSALSVIVLARVLSALGSTRLGQDRANALAAADAGLADARYALDQLPAGIPPPSSIPAAGTPPRTGALPSGATFAWRATQGGDPNRYTITASGTAGIATRTVTETATRPPRYPFALLGVAGVFFDGSVPPSGIHAETGGATDPTRSADIASNGAIVIGGGPDPGTGGAAQVTFSPAGSCTGCPVPQTRPGPWVAADPTRPAGAAACPGNGMVDGSSTPAFLTAGTYVCDTDLTLKGNVSVAASATDPVLVYLAPGASLHLGGLAMAASNDPAALIIEKAGAGAIDPGGDDDPPTFRGVIDAPHATLTSDQCNLSITGALTVGTFLCKRGASTFTLAYDAGVAALPAATWQTSGYTEIPPVRP